MRCDGCPFNTKIVESEEIYKRDILILGEAPGKQEVKEGRPFIGPSGKLLWQTMKTFGVDRKDCAVTNALECFIPKEVYDKKASYVKDPSMSCRHRLVDEILTVEPNLIIALGNIAMQSLMQDFSLKITNERGNIFDLMVGTEKRGYHQTKVMATFHPAAILRNPNDYRKFRRDLAYAHHIAKGGKPKSPGETQYKVCETYSEEFACYEVRHEFINPEFDELMAEIYACERNENGKLLVGADIETDSLDPITGDILSIGFSPRKNMTYIFNRDSLQALYSFFDDPDVEFIWHNGKFDTKFLRTHNLPARQDHDTMMLHYALDEQKGTHDLKQLSTYNLGAGDYSGEFKQFMDKGDTFADAPKEALYSYLAKDCDYTRQLFEIFYPNVCKQEDLSKLYHGLLMPLVRFLLVVEETGIWANPNYLEELDVMLNDEIKQVRAEIEESIVGHWDEIDYALDTNSGTVPDEFNPGSPKQIKWLLYTSMRLKPKNRKRDTNIETLNSISPPNPVVDGILKFRKANKKLGTYVHGIQKAIKKDGRIHCTFLAHGTETGRLSSSDPNIQNIPREKAIKDIFQAPEGRYLMDLDMAQAELRVLAALSGDETLKDVFNSGRDLHGETAALINGPDYTKEQRTAAKSVNFGICYGLTEYSLQESLGITFREANKMIRGWKEAYPKAWAFLQSQREIPAKGKYAVSPFGRRRRFPLVTPEVLNGLENESSNFAIQATASDLNLIICIEMNDKLAKYDASIVNIVHDSIIIECPENLDTVKAISELAQETLDDVAKKWLDTDVKFEIGGDYGKAWGTMKEIE